MSGYEPIHHSELKAYLRCHLYWWFTAPPPRGLFLEPCNPRAALHIGRLTHAALQAFGDQGTDPDAAFLSLALEEEARLDRAGEGLWEEERRRIREATETMVGVLRGYRTWALVHDADTEVLATEVVWGEAEPMVLKGIPFAGRFDAVIKRGDGTWVLDFKTTKSTDVGWTDQDLQAIMYTWAAQSMFPGVRGLIFRFIRKKAPWDYEQLILKSGTVTQRRDLADLTTLQNYLAALAVAVVNEIRLDAEWAPWFANKAVESYADLDAILHAPSRKENPWWGLFVAQYKAAKRLYYDQIQALKGANEFIWEVPVMRPQHEAQAYMEELVLPTAWRMMSPHPWVAPTGLGAAYALCARCSFKNVCKAYMAGADWQALLDEGFRVRQREEF